jgi:hypothetical protein
MPKSRTSVAATNAAAITSPPRRRCPNFAQSARTGSTVIHGALMSSSGDAVLGAAGMGLCPHTSVGCRPRRTSQRTCKGCAERPGGPGLGQLYRQARVSRLLNLLFGRHIPLTQHGRLARQPPTPLLPGERRGRLGVAWPYRYSLRPRFLQARMGYRCRAS